MPASRSVDRPIHVHGRVQGVRVEATVTLELGQGRWAVGRTGELRPAATASAEGRRKRCVAHAGCWGALPGPASWPAAAHAARAGRARGAWVPARRGCRGAVAGPALSRGATWLVSGEGARASPGPRRQRTA
jgi:hypothetical protein